MDGSRLHGVSSGASEETNVRDVVAGDNDDHAFVANPAYVLDVSKCLMLSRSTSAPRPESADASVDGVPARVIVVVVVSSGSGSGCDGVWVADSSEAGGWNGNAESVEVWRRRGAENANTGPEDAETDICAGNADGGGAAEESRRC